MGTPFNSTLAKVILKDGSTITLEHKSIAGTHHISSQCKQMSCRQQNSLTVQRQPYHDGPCDRICEHFEVTISDSETIRECVMNTFSIPIVKIILCREKCFAISRN